MQEIEQEGHSDIVSESGGILYGSQMIAKDSKRPNYAHPAPRSPFPLSLPTAPGRPLNQRGEGMKGV